MLENGPFGERRVKTKLSSFSQFFPFLLHMGYYLRKHVKQQVQGKGVQNSLFQAFKEKNHSCLIKASPKFHPRCQSRQMLVPETCHFPLWIYAPPGSRSLRIKHCIKGRMLRATIWKKQRVFIKCKLYLQLQRLQYIKWVCGVLECLQEGRKRDQVIESGICFPGSLLGCLRLDFSFNLRSNLVSRRLSLQETFLPGGNNCLLLPPSSFQAQVLIPEQCIIPYTFLECA